MQGESAVVGVAYSGGRDSTALLHATLAAARGCGVEVVALHVHHGLSAHADAWLDHCERQCATWVAEGHALAFDSRRVPGQPARGDSVEAWARDARYAALAEMARARRIGLVLLAHHRRDQAETVLLQALRGAGAAGLAAMPRVARRCGVTWARPWLGVASERIADYVEVHALVHVEDDSNADQRLRRNRLRAAVWPALVEAFPAAEAALARVAVHAAEAQACADELAAIDLPRVAADDGLRIDAWSELSAARRGNVLRAWLRGCTGAAPSAALAERLRDELPHGDAPAAWPIAGGQVLRRYRGVLRCEAAATVPALVREDRLGAVQDGVAPLPGWGGCLRLRPAASGGLAVEALARLRLAARGGGERFQIAPGRPPRSLARQFQALGVPAWRRGGPLLWLDDALVFVPGLGHDARTWAPAGAPQVELSWQPRATVPEADATASAGTPAGRR